MVEINAIAPPLLVSFGVLGIQSPLVGVLGVPIVSLGGLEEHVSRVVRAGEVPCFVSEVLSIQAGQIAGREGSKPSGSFIFIKIKYHDVFPLVILVSGVDYSFFSFGVSFELVEQS